MYKNPKEKNEKMTRESPQDLIHAMLKFKEKNPEHESLTVKGFALLREALKKKNK